MDFRQDVHQDGDCDTIGGITQRSSGGSRPVGRVQRRKDSWLLAGARRWVSLGTGSSTPVGSYAVRDREPIATAGLSVKVSPRDLDRILKRHTSNERSEGRAATPTCSR